MVYTLKWDAIPDLDLYSYEVRLGGTSWETATYYWQGITTSLEIPTPTQTTNYWIKALDTSGNYSESAARFQFLVNPPLAPTVNSSVVQNSVILSFSNVLQPDSLQISHYLIYRLNAVSSNTNPPPGSELFTTTENRIILSTLAAGTYTYWIKAVDTGNNQSPSSRTVIESQSAPGYTESLNITSVLSGTISNFVRVPDTLISPLIDSYEFIDNLTNFDFPNNQELIGPLLSTPVGSIDAWTTVDSILNIEFLVGTTATYQETFDLLSVQSSGQIQFNLTSLWDAGGTNVTLIPTIATSTDNLTWITFPINYQIFATNFRYVRLNVQVNGDGLSLVRFTKLKLIIGNQSYQDTGISNADSTHTNGTLVTFNLNFKKIRSIVLTPISTTTVTAVYNYSEAVNINGFWVYLYSTISGERLSGPFSWSATGEL